MTETGVRGSAGSARPSVSVIVPHYNDLAGLDRCLASLAGQAAPFDFEIIVADNNSPQGEAAVRGVVGGRAQLVVAPEKGAGPARNAGAAAARSAVLAFIDCDCVAEPGWLAAGVAALPPGGAAGGRMKVTTAEPGRVTPAEAFECVFAFDNRRYVEALGFSVTANLFCPAELFARVGGFRVGVSEDKDWCHRARDAGAPLVYAPLAVVGHPARRAWDELVVKWRRLNAETFGLMCDRPHGRARWLARNLLLPVSALVHTPRVLFSPALRRGADRWGAITILYRLRFWRLADALRLLAGPGRV
jgi:GT2 family glycosyltransferase